MKILFVTDRVYADSDPNLNLINSLRPCLEKDAQVFFMGHDPDPARAGEWCFFYRLDEQVRTLFFSLDGLPLIRKALRLFCHPVLSFFGAFKLFNIDLITVHYVRKLRALDAAYGFDAIISVSAPFYTSKALARLRTNARKCIFLCDPYGRHYTMGNRRTRAMEKKAFAAVDAAMVPALLSEDYADPKVISYEFPGVVTTQPPHRAGAYDDKKINLVFVGSLYADIRSPEYLYELLRRLDSDRYHLTVVGGTYGYFSQEFHEKYDEIVKKCVTVVGKVDRERARQYLWQADVLVNIGNRIENMLPSKVLEYISTGKPVLNITQIRECPSLPYFEKYGNTLTLHTDEPVTDAQLRDLREFLEKRERVPEKVVAERFYTAMPAYVAGQLKDLLRG